MAMNQIVRYLENKDASSIHYRQFNSEMRDKYPTFSICLKGSRLHWKKVDVDLFERFGLRGYKYGKILSGEKVFSYEYNSIAKLYNKISMDVTNISSSGFGGMSLNLTDIVTRAHFETLDSMDTLDYGIGIAKDWNYVKDLPFEISFQTPESVCFTRKPDDQLD